MSWSNNSYPPSLSLQDVQPLDQPGVATKRTVLNVFGNGGHGGRYILDSLKVSLTLCSHQVLFTAMSSYQTGAVATDYYQDSDLTVGGVVNLWGRKLLLCDCDQFTKEYYSSKYGIGKL